MPNPPFGALLGWDPGIPFAKAGQTTELDRVAGMFREKDAISVDRA